MSLDTLKIYIRQYLASQPDGIVELMWQGGEPTMRGIDFFRHAVAYADAERRPEQYIRHSLQTNGTLITDEWARFFVENDFLVGVSIDGQAEHHDRFRLNKAGHSTYHQVIRGWDCLKKYDVQSNILCTVHAANMEDGAQIYCHFRDELEAQYMQFIPIVERCTADLHPLAEKGWLSDQTHIPLYQQKGSIVTSRSVSPDGWGRFMIEVFDEWFTRDIGSIFIQNIDVLLGAVFGMHTLCVHAPECGRALAIEHNGDIYSCDHYVEPGYRLGNIYHHSLSDTIKSPAQRAFGQAKSATLTDRCRNCQVRWACHGGCPKDRFISSNSPSETHNHNFLCAGYEAFFTHATPGIRQLANLIQAGFPASAIYGTPQ